MPLTVCLHLDLHMHRWYDHRPEPSPDEGLDFKLGAKPGSCFYTRRLGVSRRLDTMTRSDIVDPEPRSLSRYRQLGQSKTAAFA